MRFLVLNVIQIDEEEEADDDEMVEEHEAACWWERKYCVKSSLRTRASRQDDAVIDTASFIVSAVVCIYIKQTAGGIESRNGMSE